MTFRSMRAAVGEGNLRLAVSRGITVIIQATAAAYKAPAPIIRKAEALIQATRETIHGAVIGRAALGGVSGRVQREYEPKISKKLRDYIEQQQEEEARKSAGIILTEEQKNKAIVRRLLSEDEEGWASFVDMKKYIPDVVTSQSLIDKAREIVKKTVDDPWMPEWIKFGHLTGAASLVKAAETIVGDDKHANQIRKIWRAPIERLISQFKAPETFPKGEGAEAGIYIKTAFPERTKNILVSIFGLSENAQRNTKLFPDGLRVWGRESAKEVLTAIHTMNARFPWIKQTLMGLSWTA
jgi:hypothetical protein